MGPNQTKFISMGPIWKTSGTETVISVPVSVLGSERAGTEMGCILRKNRQVIYFHRKRSISQANISRNNGQSK